MLRADVLERAGALVTAGRVGAARPLLAALRRLQEGAADQDCGPIDALETRLLLREGRHDAARAMLDAAVARRPVDAQLRRTRAELLLVLGERVAAATDAAEAVMLEPWEPAGKAVLGVAMGELGQCRDAIACLREAVVGDPGCPPYRLALARVQQRAGDVAAARATLEVAIAVAPNYAGARSALVALVAGSGDFTTAVALAKAARQAGAIDACLLGLHGHALSCLGLHEAAAEAYQDALALEPEDPYVRHLVAASGRVAAAAQAPEAYIRVLFDGYAHRFEEHIASLGYRVPGLMRAAVLRHAPGAGEPPLDIGPVLDLGCGTGLAAAAMSGLRTGPWHGVDLSPAMLARAAATGLYERLLEADLLVGLAQPGPLYRLIVAADVLCYFGTLEPVLAAARGRLASDGIMVLSLEALAEPAAEPGWRLGPLGRYAHTPATLAAAAEAAGLAVLALDHETLRREGDAAVAGLVAVLAPLPTISRA